MSNLRVLLALVLILCVCHGDASCGYKACPKTKGNMINVHLVPHSHDDVGWLKTVDQYYYGSKNNIQHAGVQYILDSVVQELLKDPSRRFIYVESAFFFKWYNQQPYEVQKYVKKLIDEGRLEFAGGGWSMNDEAAAHYQSIIDQFSLGLKELTKTFGICARPRIGWQIDPFGHSREMASIFAQMGYDGEFFARMDWVEKNARLNNMTGEMIWKTSDALDESTELFTGVLYNHYSAPPGFCFDSLCSDDPIIDDNSHSNNVEIKVDNFIAYILQMDKYYRTSHLLVPMGDDFNYENAALNFKNMDKLIKYVNDRQQSGSKVNVFYSTPGCYLNSIHNLLQTWPNKTQDFFPYSTDWHTYWTGYYSSRPTQKRFERDGNHFLQVVRQLSVFANLTDTTTTANIKKLSEVMGVMQHHDAITGTEKQHVSNDYDRMLHEGIMAAQNTARTALQKLTNLTTGEFESCLQLNISECNATRMGANNVVVTLYNPLAHATRQFVRVPVKLESHVVTNENGQEIRSQLVPVPQEVLNLSHRTNDTQYELVFEAHVEKLANYYITVRPQPNPIQIIETSSLNLSKRSKKKGSTKYEDRTAGDIIVQNSLIKLTFGSTGHLNTIQMNGITENLCQDFFYYRSANGNNSEFKYRSSGAYIFRPNSTEILVGERVQLKVFDGPLVKEVHQIFNDWASQVIRLYEGVNRVEFEWLIGPIPIADGIGKEVITRFTSNINNDDVFYTDTNGREMLKRVKNQREYFKPNVTEKISSNYYPITARLALQNEHRRMTLLTDRAQGGSSIKNGTLELMIHRRMVRDDAFGVGEALNEIAYGKGLIARGKVYLIVNTLARQPTIKERYAQQEIHLPFWKFFSNASHSVNKVVPRIPEFSSLPLNVHVLTLQRYSISERLLRLEHFMDGNETFTITFNLRAVFDMLSGEEIRETTLDGNMLLSDMKRFKFQADGTESNKIEYYTSKHTPLVAKKKDSINKFTISMVPMQIRTFIIKWK